MSLTAAFYLDPLRDIYEVCDGEVTLPGICAESLLGFHHLHLLPAAD